MPKHGEHGYRVSEGYAAQGRETGACWKRNSEGVASLHRNIATVCGSARPNRRAKMRDDVSEHIWDFLPEVAVPREGQYLVSSGIHR